MSVLILSVWKHKPASHSMSNYITHTHTHVRTINTNKFTHFDRFRRSKPVLYQQREESVAMLAAIRRSCSCACWRWTERCGEQAFCRLSARAHTHKHTCVIENSKQAGGARKYPPPSTPVVNIDPGGDAGASLWPPFRFCSTAVLFLPFFQLVGQFWRTVHQDHVIPCSREPLCVHRGWSEPW